MDENDEMNEIRPLITNLKNIDRPYTELELNEVNLTQSEIVKCPNFRGILSLLDGFLYPFTSMWFMVRFFIYRFFFVEMFLVVFYIVGILVMGFGLGFLIAWIIVIELAAGSLRDELVAFIIVGVCSGFVFSLGIFIVANLFTPLFMSFTFKRLSNVVEQIMRGNISNLGCCYCPKSGKDFSLISFVWGIFLMGINYLIKYLLHKTIVAGILALVNLIPGVGQVLMVPIVALECGYGCFNAVFSRKGKGYVSGLLWVSRNVFTVMGVGFGSMIIYSIFPLNIFYFFFADVIGTRVYVHLDWRKNRSYFKEYGGGEDEEDVRQKQKRYTESDPLLITPKKFNDNYEGNATPNFDDDTETSDDIMEEGDADQYSSEQNSEEEKMNKKVIEKSGNKEDEDEDEDEEVDIIVKKESEKVEEMDINDLLQRIKEESEKHGSEDSEEEDSDDDNKGGFESSTLEGLLGVKNTSNEIKIPKGEGSSEEDGNPVEKLKFLSPSPPHQKTFSMSKVKLNDEELALLKEIDEMEGNDGEGDGRSKKKKEELNSSSPEINVLNEDMNEFIDDYLAGNNTLKMPIKLDDSDEENSEEEENVKKKESESESDDDDDEGDIIYV